MIARIILLVLLTLLTPPWAEVPKLPFSIAVVPSRSFGELASISMAHDKPAEFFVVLTNVSGKSQPVFEDWNSWGYQTISFEFTTRAGEKVVVSRREQDFVRNGATTFTVLPGEHQVFAIRLDQWWEAKPTLHKVDEMPIRLKAIYEVSPTPEATQQVVWTGRVESREYNMTLRQW